MKGSMLSRYKVGQVVTFGDRQGRITKLHKSGSSGVAKIKPLDGTKSVSRSLRWVR